MLLVSQKTCQRKRDCYCGRSRPRRVMLGFGVKISPPAGEMGNYLMPSFINTGMKFEFSRPLINLSVSFISKFFFLTATTLAFISCQKASQSVLWSENKVRFQFVFSAKLLNFWNIKDHLLSNTVSVATWCSQDPTSKVSQVLPSTVVTETHLLFSI